MRHNMRHESHCMQKGCSVRFYIWLKYSTVHPGTGCITSLVLVSLFSALPVLSLSVPVPRWSVVVHSHIVIVLSIFLSFICYCLWLLFILAELIYYHCTRYDNSQTYFKSVFFFKKSFFKIKHGFFRKTEQ